MERTCLLGGGPRGGAGLPGSYGVTVFALAGWDGTPEPVAAPRTGTVSIG